MVGHLLRYHPAVVALKGLIDQGRLGKLYYLYSNRLNLGRFRTEENILWSFAPHDLSVFLYLLGEQPTSVAAHGGSYLNHGIPDVTVTTLEFRSGVEGHTFVSWLRSSPPGAVTSWWSPSGGSPLTPAPDEHAGDSE
jgi:UDP-2-acetamido-3-amino-2,3-dideoxy-glucuronate N-acetyltransferase